MDALFGEGQSGLKVVFFVIVVLGLLALAFWLLRRFGGARLATAATRGRQLRLAVIDQATVDRRRRLVLIRRDDVEHLLIIGGPRDVVVEQNIVRAATALRETGPAHPPAMPRGGPLRPEPAPPGAPAPRKARTADPLAELADALSRVPRVGEPAEHGRPPRLQPVPPARRAEAIKPATDQNLSEIAQRLEATLRRPAKSSDGARTAAGNPKTAGEQAVPEPLTAAPPSARLDTGEGPQLDAIADRGGLTRLKAELDHGVLLPIYAAIKQIKEEPSEAPKAPSEPAAPSREPDTQTSEPAAPPREPNTEGRGDDGPKS
jgi:flagellar protein FliO/FliZ